MFSRNFSRILMICLLSATLATASLAADLKTTMKEVEKVLEKEDPTVKTLEESGEKLRDAIKKNPDAKQKPEVQLLLGRINLEMGEFYRAANILKRLRDKKPEGISKHDILTPLVHAFIGKGGYIDAVEITDLLLDDEGYADDPRRADLLYEVASTQETVLKNIKEAAELYSLILKDHPESKMAPRAAVRAGYLLEQKIGNTKKAVQTYLKVAEEYPEYQGERALNPGVYSGWTAGWRALNLAGVAHNKPRHRRGLADFDWQKKIADQLLEQFPGKAGRISTFMMKSALLKYNRFPQDRDGKKRNVEDALKWARKALEKNPDNSPAIKTLALYAQKDRQKYLVQYISDESVTRSQVGKMAASINDFDNVEKALKARPNNVKLLHRAVNLALESGKNDAAKKYANKLSEADAITKEDLQLISKGVFEYAKASNDLDMLLKLADTPRFKWNIREQALRASIPLLAQNEDTERIVNKLRQYADTYSYMYVDGGREKYSRVADLWKTASGAFNNNKQSYDALVSLNKADLFKNGIALHETLRWELGRLATNLGKKDLAAQYFERRFSNDALAADCWMQYFEAAQNNNDVLTQLQLAAEFNSLRTADRWKTAKKKYASGILNKLKGDGNLSATQRDLVKILRKDLKGSDLETLRKDYNDFLSKHDKSSEAPWVLLHVARMLSNKAPKRRLPAFGQWLYGWSDKIDSAYWKSRTLLMAAKLYAQAGSHPALPNIQKWSAVGPFPPEGKGLGKTPVDPAQQPDLGATIKAGDEKSVKWQEIRTTPDGFLAFGPHFLQEDAALACAVTFVHSPEKQDVQLFTGMAGSAKVWVNGKQAGAATTPPEPYEPDAYMAEITLKKGMNRILITSLQKTEALKWGVNVRFANLKKAVKASPTPEGNDTQSISASPTPELKMKAAYQKAAALATGIRKKKLLLKPYEKLQNWNRNTEARGGYRHLLARCGAMAQEKLAMSYAGWNNEQTTEDDQYVSRKRFLNEVRTYLDKYRPGDRFRLLNNYLPYAKEQVEQAFALTNRYLQQHPGDWPLIQTLWNKVGNTREARRAGVQQTLDLMNEYPGSPWLINLAFKQFNTKNAELLKKRYEATGLTKHKLQWLDHWYNQAGRSVMKKVEELEEKRREYVNRADQHKREAREAEKDAQQLLREAKSFERKVEKAQQNE